MRMLQRQGHLPPEKGGSLALLCMDRAVTVQEGGFGLTQETNAHPEDVMGSGMWREGWECNDRGLAPRRTGGGPAHPRPKAGPSPFFRHTLQNHK